jgi:hypothetical protein
VKRLLVMPVAVLAFVACAKDTPPKAFPGRAIDKAAEYVRRAQALGLPGGNPKDVARSFGMVGDGFCVDDKPELRNNTSFETVENPVRAWRLANLTVDVYCPWLSRFPKPAKPG